MARVPRATELQRRTLLTMLSPNGLPKQLGERACVVRAEDPAGFVPLPDADLEIAQVMRYFGLIGLEGVRAKPGVANLVEVLDAGYRVLHYSGHGLATTLSEGLPLVAGETLQPRDLSSLSGYRTPFVYLSACEVGRTRHIPGGRQSGLAVGLIQNGAPAVIGCLHAVPDGLAGLMATAFYRAAKTASVGDALCLARRYADAQGINPACWGVYALYGDPSMTISPYAAREIRQVRDHNAGWPASLSRWLAVRREQDRNECLNSLIMARQRADAPQADYLQEAADWVVTSFEPASCQQQLERLALCARVGVDDLIGGAALRLLLAMETIQTFLSGVLIPAGSLDPAKELRLGIDWSQRLNDVITWAAFAVVHGLDRIKILSRNPMSAFLEGAASILDAWAPLAPEYAAWRDKVRDALRKTSKPAEANG